MAASDGTLVLGVRAGDRAAFAELYDRRARLIRAICHDQTRDPHAAADLTQEVFLRAFKNLAELRDPNKFPQWLTGIARQVCREWRRTNKRRQAHLENYRMLRLANRNNETQQHAIQRIADRPGTGLSDATADAAREVLAAMGDREGPTFPALSDRERLTLHAYYAQGCNVEEARTVLGLSRATFYRVLSSACARLRAALSGQEVQR